MEKQKTKAQGEMGMHWIWEEIERSENYLVCSMYEEAASLTSSILRRSPHSCEDRFHLHNAMECAGMVFVQSLPLLSRASDIVDELRSIFDSVETIPVQVLLTGACFQISEGSTVAVKEILEEFLEKWTYVDEKYYVLVGSEGKLNSGEWANGPFVLDIENYLEVVELYAITLLGTIYKDIDGAISWVEKAALPEGNQRGFLRRLHSLCPSNASNEAQGSSSGPPVASHKAYTSTLKPNISEESLDVSKTNDLCNEENVLKLSRQPLSCLWWFRSITIKFGNSQLVISNGKIMLGCLIILLFYVYRRKRASLQRTVRIKMLSVKKAFVDLWQLAFSYQVNPLAAVQSVPTATLNRS